MDAQFCSSAELNADGFLAQLDEGKWLRALLLFRKSIADFSFVARPRPLVSFSPRSVNLSLRIFTKPLRL
jgi:hypothetical protein